MWKHWGSGVDIFYHACELIADYFGRGIGCGHETMDEISHDLDYWSIATFE